ncbi:hypothetical protein K505DRAFT_418496 [Melanomma pulvis-pyrius CBS 109.77]|uniref:DUF829-domain-containing protein n=1 Tax=Melanomma pulvis-pyrius CBS 109.77 TaxID=1314802 RepID=A0A6A6X8Q2_9PLEO|nr:hypothetical protein K505DRAFT_418496 [Melanomma pulvis-pyrius CBS 109.77]
MTDQSASYLGPAKCQAFLFTSSNNLEKFGAPRSVAFKVPAARHRRILSKPTSKSQRATSTSNINNNTMATAVSPSVVTKPLSDFQEIGYNTYIYTPTSYTPKSPLILFFSWNAAAAKHIAKYTVAYQRLFPSARIVLVRCFTADTFRTVSAYRKQHGPAREAVHEHIKSGGEVLVHSSSNGGGNQVVEFVKGWREKYGELLPMRAQVLDSGPGEGAWMKSHAAISHSLPKGLFWSVFGSGIVHALLACMFLYNTLTGSENMMVVMCRQLNDPEIFDRSVPRVYLYSKADAMVDWKEVEVHADEAAAKGWNVQKIKFEKSPHVGHIMEDPEKYWGAIIGVYSEASTSVR